MPVCPQAVKFSYAQGFCKGKTERLGSDKENCRSRGQREMLEGTKPLASKGGGQGSEPREASSL